MTAICWPKRSANVPKSFNAGAAPLVDMDIKKHKPTDIALFEIAEGKLTVTREG